MLHPQRFSLSRHQLSKVVFATGNGFGQRYTRVVTRLHNHAADQVRDLGRGSWVKEHA